MEKLRAVIQARLKSIHPRVWFQQAPANAQYPYLVYDITQALDDGESLQAASVDVDGWDMPGNGDTTVLEVLMSSVNLGINKNVVETEDMAVAFYLDRKIPLIDDDKRIKRRKYIYDARIFERS